MCAVLLKFVCNSAVKGSSSHITISVCGAVASIHKKTRTEDLLVRKLISTIYTKPKENHHICTQRRNCKKNHNCHIKRGKCHSGGQRY